MDKELTMKQKWAEVDWTIKNINSRKAKGLNPYYTQFDEYIDKTFNKTK